MIEWSRVFETKIELVDTQHKKLFKMLNDMAKELETGHLDIENINRSFDRLLEYSKKHFKDEEQLMSQYNLDESFISVHKMEHHSFIYDITRMKDAIIINDEIIDRAEDLISFISSWIILHTLKRDPIMAEQIKNIIRGMNPEEAYQKAKCITPPPDAARMMLDALVHLWGDATKRVNQLEEELANLKK